MPAYSYRQGYMVNVSPTHVSIFLQTGVHGQCVTNSCQHILTDRGTWSMCHQLMSAYSYRQGYMVNVSPTHVNIFLQTGVHGQCVTNSCQHILTDRGTWSMCHQLMSAYSYRQGYMVNVSPTHVSVFLQKTGVHGQYMSPTHVSIFLQTGVHSQCVTNSCQHILTDRGTWSMCHQLMSPTHVSIFLQTEIHGQYMSATDRGTWSIHVTNSCQRIPTDRGTWSIHVTNSCQHIPTDRDTWSIHVSNSCQRIPTDRDTWSMCHQLMSAYSYRNTRSMSHQLMSTYSYKHRYMDTNRGL